MTPQQIIEYAQAHPEDFEKVAGVALEAIRAQRILQSLPPGDAEFLLSHLTSDLESTIQDMLDAFGASTFEEYFSGIEKMKMLLRTVDAPEEAAEVSPQSEEGVSAPPPTPVLPKEPEDVPNPFPRWEQRGKTFRRDDGYRVIYAPPEGMWVIFEPGVDPSDGPDIGGFDTPTDCMEWLDAET